MKGKFQHQQMYTRAEAMATEAKAILEGEAPDMEHANRLLAESNALLDQANALKRAQGILDAAGQLSMPAPLPAGGVGNQPTAEGGDAVDPAIKAVHVIRYGDVSDEPTDLVMHEVYGGDYRPLFDQQTKAFTNFLRTGIGAPILRQQMWSPADIKAMLRYGMGVGEIKTTMIEGQDTLGGYAVPAQQASDVIRRLPGLTAVRGGGATVIQTASASIEWLKLTGGGDQYPSGLRGAWGTEVQAPTEKNIALGLETIPVHTYTYKFSMSQSVVEDAINLLDLFLDEVMITLAADEDTTLLTGDGAGKPRGILPSSANGESITEVISGNASALTWAGLRNLRRGIASQYRMMNRTSWIGNSDTGADIEAMVDGISREYVDALVADEVFPKLRGIWRESEAMPDVASGAYPLIYGDLSGYKIVERLGLSIVRFQDSNTGTNKVEYHVRRRIGGRLLEPWKLAVQKVLAS